MSTIKNDRNFRIANKLSSKRFLATGQRKKWLETLSKVARSSYKVAKLATLHYARPQQRGGSIAEWLACGTQAQKGRGSNRSRDAVG